MTKANPLDPPKLATWLLEHFSPFLGNTPLAGDLVESYRQGRSPGWYRRQVFWSVLIGLLNLFRKRWGRLVYAVGCGSLISAAWFSIFLGTGNYSAHQFAVICDGHIWSGPVQVTGPSSALPAVFALYAKSFGMQWPWSLIYQIAFLTAFQAALIAFALGAHIGLARILKAQNFLRALMVAVVVLAGGNVAVTLLSVSSAFRESAWWVLVSMPTIALLIGMQKVNPGNTARPVCA